MPSYTNVLANCHNRLCSHDLSDITQITIVLRTGLDVLKSCSFFLFVSCSV